jgi:hypothetical protein
MQEPYSWGRFSVFRSYFVDKSSLSRGCVEILEGFPRPVGGAVVNLHLVLHGFHQRRHLPVGSLACSNSSVVNGDGAFFQGGFDISKPSW